MKKKISENYLDKIPQKNSEISWTENDCKVTLEVQNKGFANKIAQKLFKKPKISYIHLDEMGSFIWPIIDGAATVSDIAKRVDEHFGEKAHPLYERLIKYLEILKSYSFITFK